MILFIDDEPRVMQSYVNELSVQGLDTVFITSIAELSSFLAKEPVEPQCIVLDVMFPCSTDFPEELTASGLTSGLPVFASLRSHFPDAPVVVFTNSISVKVRNFFKSQQNCWFYSKEHLLPFEFAEIVAALIEHRGSNLIRQLQSCAPGITHSAEFERILGQIVRFLFIPPLERLLVQSRRADGHEIRDLVLPNTGTSLFWDSLRQEFQSRHIVLELKNHNKSVGKQQVAQLREYLRRKSMGRFGLLVSRLPPSASALQARADAYSDENCLILFLSDAELSEMVRIRETGADPSVVLQTMKEEFELSY